METTQPKKIEELRIKLFADDGKREDIIEYADDPLIKGFTTNPSLMHEAGVTDYESYARELLTHIGAKAISFEVFGDDFAEMERQARIIHAWSGEGQNLYVKIPVINTRGESAAPLISTLSAEGMKLNVTLIMTAGQVEEVAKALDPETPAIISIFAGRIADVGIDPLPIMREAKRLLADRPKAELLWASCRELFNIYEAESIGAEIITVPPAVLTKLGSIGTNLEQLSLDGAKAFYEAGKASGFTL